MRNGREVGWVVFLAGLPFAPFLFRPWLDLWHSHAVWAQAWTIVLIGLWWTQRTRQTIAMPALSAWLGWLGVSFLISWVAVVSQEKVYPLTRLPGMLHLIMVVLLVQAALALWTPTFLTRLLTVLAWTGVVLVVYGYLQVLNLDQFFNTLDPDAHRDVLVGTTGNPTHFAAQLAFLLPIFLIQSGRGWGWIALATGGLLGLSGSQGGQLAALGAGGWMLWSRGLRWRWGLGIVGLLVIVWMAFHPPSFDPHGRLAAWNGFFHLFQQKPLTGFGPGFVMEFSRMVTEGPLHQWRHVHNEYLQGAIEYGVIGMALIGLGMWEWRKRLLAAPRSLLRSCCAAILVAVALNSLVNFPLHLWVTGHYAFVAYCGGLILDQQEVVV